CELRDIRKCCVVRVGGTSACVAIFVQMPQLDVEYRRLYRIKPRVHADAFVIVTLGLAVVRDRTHFGGEFVVVREDRTAVAIAAEILRREERRAADAADRTGLLPPSVRPNVVGP